MNILHNKYTNPKQISIQFIPKEKYTQLTVELPANQIGIICRITSVLFLRGWDIIEATADTSTRGFVKDVFFVKGRFGQEMNSVEIEKIREDLIELFFEGLSVLNYLQREAGLGIFRDLQPSESFDHLRIGEKKEYKPAYKKSVHIFNPEKNDITIIDVFSKDRPGILFQISEILFLSGIDILSFSARCDEGEIRDTFLVRKENGDKITDLTMIEKLKNGIFKVL